MLEGGQEEGPEFSAAGIRPVEKVLFQKAREVSLGQVLRIFGGLAAAPDITVKRTPVAAAQRSHGGLARFGVARSSCHHDAPLG